MALRTCFWLCALHALVRLVPWSLIPVDLDLDSSWSWVFHLVRERPFACGRDLVYTSGPWGCLLTRSWHPATFAWKIGLLSAVALLLTAVLWRIVSLRPGVEPEAPSSVAPSPGAPSPGAPSSGRARAASPWASLLWTVVLIEAMSAWGAQENLFFHVDLALLWLHWSQDRAPEGNGKGGDGGRLPPGGWLLHALAAAAALGALVKFTLFLGALVPIAVIALREILHRRRFPWIAATFCASLLAWWLLARQPISGFFPYLSISADIAQSYSRSMGLQAPLRHVVLFVASGLLVLFVLARAWGVRRPDGSVLRILGLCALLFLIFKTAFVRYDVWHTLPAAAALLFWLAAGVLSSRARPRRAGTIAAAAAALFSILLLVDGLVVEGGPLVEGRMQGALSRVPFAEQVRAWPRQALAAARVLAGRSQHRAEHERALALMRRLAPLPPISGTVDVYPELASLALAHGLDYRPRPVIQSHTAHTPRLLALNAEHLLGPLAPDKLLFKLDAIDARLPSMQDSLSWPALLSRYEVAGAAAGHLILARRELPRTVSWRPIASRRAEFGRTVALADLSTDPAQGFALWARIELHPTVLGRVATVAFRPPTLLLGLRTANGEESAYRLVPGIAEAGFVLSPRIESNDAFRRFAARGRSALPEQEVRAFTVSSREVDDLSWAYGREYEIRLSVLEIGP